MGTYLEDYLESMYMLPSEIKRNFDLMRELDKTSYPLLEELKTAHKEYLRNARKKVMERCADKESGEPDEAELRELVDADATLELLREKHQRVVQKLDEKIAIAAQSYDIVDHHIRRLDQDLEAYAALLKQNGEFEEEKTLKKKSKLSSSASQGAALPPLPKSKHGTSSSSAANGPASGGVGGSSSTTVAAPASSTSTSSGRKRSATDAALDVVPAVQTQHSGAVNLPIVVGADDLPIDPNEPIYCHCRRVSYGQMVGCDNDDCKYEWFHFECVGLTDQPAGTWYCKDCKVLLGIK